MEPHINATVATPRKVLTWVLPIVIGMVIRGDVGETLREDDRNGVGCCFVQIRITKYHKNSHNVESRS